MKNKRIFLLAAFVVILCYGISRVAISPLHIHQRFWFGDVLKRATRTAIDEKSQALWLSDFETPNEYAIRWTVDGAFAAPSSEHVSHGLQCVKLTFQGRPESFYKLDDYLARNSAAYDWRKYSSLEFDLASAQFEKENLLLVLKSDDGRSYEYEIAIEPRSSVHVSLPLADAAGFVDLSHIVELSLLKRKASASKTFYLDAVHLERSASQGSPAVAGKGESKKRAQSSQKETPLADAAITPQMLGAFQFSQHINQWRTFDPQNGKPIIRVPLILVGPQQPLSVGLVVSGGMPFAMGQLKPTDQMRLSDASGSIWPLQVKVLATWQDASVKWLLVTSQIPVHANDRQLWLEYGQAVSADPLPTPSVRVEESPERITVSNGAIRFSVSKKRFNLFDSVYVDRHADGLFAEDEKLTTAGGDLVIRHDNREFRASRDSSSYKLEVEELGALRSTLKASGSLRDESGNGYCQFIIRIQAFANQPQLRVFHTFIYTGYPANRIHHEYKGIRLPDNETIQEISLEMNAVLTKKTQLITSDDNDLISTELDAPLSILQRNYETYELRKDETSMRRATRNQGWMLLQNDASGLLLGVRDFWQQYPKELIANPKSGKLIVKLWPNSAGELSFETGPEAYGPDDVARGSAFGLAKTHELIFGFFDRAFETGSTSTLVLPYLEPWLLIPYPEWLQATDVIGQIGPAQLRRFTEHEVMLDDLFSWAQRQIKDFSWYGMLDYGDTMTWYRKEAYDKSYDEWGWHPEGRWGWHNCEAVGLHGGALMSFVRTANLKYFRLAEAKARHVMDVDTVHYNTVANDARLRGKIPDTFSKVGSMHRHSAYHWSGRNDEASHTNITGLLFYYYLTGDARAWDVINEVGSFFLLDPVTYTKLPSNAPLRAIGSVLLGDVQMYEATHDARYRKSADRWAQVLLSGQQQDGTWRETYDPKHSRWEGELKTNFIVYHVLPALIAYHRISGNELVSRAILLATDAMVSKERYLPFFDALAYSYLLSGKGEYLDEGLRRIRELERVQRHVDDPTMNGMVFQKATYDHVGPTLYSVPFVIGAMDAMDYPTLAKTFSRSAEFGVRNSELLNATAHSELRTPNSALPYEVLVVPSTEKVWPDVGAMPGSHANPATLSLARNEYESLQLVVRSTTALKRVALEIEDLRQVNGGGVIPKDAISYSPVGFVKTHEPGYPVSHVGFWPDPLLGAGAFDVKPNWPQSIWVTVYASPTTPAGEYAGALTIHPENAPSTQVKLLVRVWNFELPKTPSLKSAFDVYPSRIKSAYKEFFPQWWAKWEGRDGELENLFYDDLIRHRLAPIMNADISEANVSHLVKQLRDQGLSAFGIGRFGGSFNNNWPDDPKQFVLLEPVYRRYAYELKSAGLLDKHYIYTYDEPKPGLERVASVAQMIHRADPALRNLVVLEDPLDVEKLKDWFKPIDIVCLYNRTFDPSAAKRLSLMGKEIWLYVAGPKPPFPTLVIDYPSMAYRIIPWMCWKYGAKGLLYWSVNYWTKNPYEEPMNTNWQQNGNGLLYYPGPNGPVGSIRLEVLRDGMEDYEYLAMLDQLINRIKAIPQAMADSKVQALVANANELLSVDPSLVKSMSEYSSDSRILNEQREIIAGMIEKLQKLLAG